MPDSWDYTPRPLVRTLDLIGPVTLREHWRAWRAERRAQRQHRPAHRTGSHKLGRPNPCPGNYR